MCPLQHDAKALGDGPVMCLHMVLPLTAIELACGAHLVCFNLVLANSTELGGIADEQDAQRVCALETTLNSLLFANTGLKRTRCAPNASCMAVNRGHLQTYHSAISMHWKGQGSRVTGRGGQYRHEIEVLFCEA